jgi:hypothetical protein
VRREARQEPVELLRLLAAGLLESIEDVGPVEVRRVLDELGVDVVHEDEPARRAAPEPLLATAEEALEALAAAHQAPARLGPELGDGALDVARRDRARELLGRGGRHAAARPAAGA